MRARGSPRKTLLALMTYTNTHNMTTKQQFELEERTGNAAAWLVAVAVAVVVVALLFNTGATVGKWLDAPAKNVRATQRGR